MALPSSESPERECAVPSSPVADTSEVIKGEGGETSSPQPNSTSTPAYVPAITRSGSLTFGRTPTSSQESIEEGFHEAESKRDENIPVAPITERGAPNAESPMVEASIEEGASALKEGALSIDVTESSGVETPLEDHPSPSSQQSVPLHDALNVESADPPRTTMMVVESGELVAPSKPKLDEQPTMSASSDDSSELSFADEQDVSSPLPSDTMDREVKMAPWWRRSKGIGILILLGVVVFVVGSAFVVNSIVEQVNGVHKQSMIGSAPLAHDQTANPTLRPSPMPTELPTASKPTLSTPTPSTVNPALTPTELPTELPTESKPTPSTTTPSTVNPTLTPTARPTDSPTMQLTSSPSIKVLIDGPNDGTAGPTLQPTVAIEPDDSLDDGTVPGVGQSLRPTKALAESSSPTPQPSSLITSNPTQAPTEAATEEQSVLDVPILHSDSDTITYVPGDLTVKENGLLLSTGLRSKVIAESRRRVQYNNGEKSRVSFHDNPDFGGTFAVPVDDASNPGGWVYVSNSEVEETGRGGVGAITFDKDGNILDYRRILTDTTMNCGGGETPWGTWITCEEETDGQVWEVSPSGSFRRKTVLGGEGGRFESFAYDVRDADVPRFFVTEDFRLGALRRFTPHPDSVDWTNPTTMLHGKGTLDYLVLSPLEDGAKRGTFTWSQNLKRARQNAFELFPNTEGIDVANNELFFVSKKKQEMTVLNLDTGEYNVVSTTRGLFDGKPDQIRRITKNEGLLYFTEEGGEDAGIHGRDLDGRFFTILESPVWKDETTGLSFSPDGKHLYVAYQKNGMLFDVWREDGLPFDGRSINVKFHATDTDVDR